MLTDHQRMIEQLGQRLRTALARDDGGGSGSPEPATASGSAGVAVEFVAYGEDCLLSGLVRLTSDRLTDMLNDHDEYVLADVLLERLADGSGLEVKEVVVLRDDLLMVHATGPRGNIERRHRTRTYPVALQVGPYRIHGRLHASYGLDPLLQLRRRTTMVPLTDASIAFHSGAIRQHRSIGDVVINRLRIDWIVPAPEDGLAELPDHPDQPPNEPGPWRADPIGLLANG
jgi:hypothetical protein